MMMMMMIVMLMMVIMMMMMMMMMIMVIVIVITVTATPKILTLINVLMTFFSQKVILIGAEDALYGISTRNGGKKKPVQIPGVGNIYQMSLVEELSLIIAIAGWYILNENQSLFALLKCGL